MKGISELKTAALTLAIALPMLAGASADFNATRGMYLEKKQAGVSWHLVLIRGAQKQAVTESFDFHTGDRFQLEVSLNKAGFVYILNRTLNGDAATLKTKGIDIVAEEDRRSGGVSVQNTYRLLYPRSLSASPTLMQPGNISLPAGGALMRMDQAPGVEKLFVIWSPTPLDLNKYFAARGERVQIGGAPAPVRPAPGKKTPAPAPPQSAQVDTDEQVEARLNADLAAYGGNTQIARNTSEKGILITTSAPGTAGSANPPGGDTGSYGIVTDSGKPASFEITLKHLP